VVDGQPVLLFRTNPGDDPIWIVPGPSLTGPWDMTLARPVHSPGLYAPRLVRGATGGWHLIGFVTGSSTGFVGELSDSVPVRYAEPTGLTCDVVVSP
jgi:beta-fructofuranosidase